MNNRNKLLAALMILQIMVIGYIYRPGKISAPPTTDLFTGLETGAVKSLEITDDQGKTLTLTKNQNNWSLELEPGVPFPADPEKIEELLKKVATLKSTRLVTRTKASHDRLEVEDNKFSRRLKIIPENSAATTLYLGTAPNYQTIHLRNGNSDNVYLAHDFSTWEVTTDHESWWQNKYINLSPDELNKVELQNSHGSFTLKKTENVWHTDVGQLAAAKVQDFIDQAGQILLTGVVLNKNDYPTGEPLTTLKLTTKENIIKLLIWELPGNDGEYIMKSSASPFYVEAASYGIKTLLEQKLADLLTTPVD
ncbi:MAG: DUF4340 domain-containing protein [Proteobacteria bacterium]|nr:DUF4340 domain-containing protein [Pseudomonadota bacterium]MBU1716900.1 DUF4340 domain-containing protein [Pseudomonadota bacterium]